jgi:hypothetical protein
VEATRADCGVPRRGVIGTSGVGGPTKRVGARLITTSIDYAADSTLLTVKERAVAPRMSPKLLISCLLCLCEPALHLVGATLAALLRA